MLLTQIDIIDLHYKKREDDHTPDGTYMIASVKAGRKRDSVKDHCSLSA